MKISLNGHDAVVCIDRWSNATIVADANHFNDPKEVAESIFVLYGYRVDPGKIKKIYLKYQLCGSNTEYAGYYVSDSGVRGAFQVWSLDVDELEAMQ